MSFFQQLGFTESEIDFILRILSTILHLGNINFLERDTVIIQNPEIFETVASLLGVNEKDLQKVVLTYFLLFLFFIVYLIYFLLILIFFPNSKNVLINSKVTQVFLSLKEVCEIRDSFCSQMYAILFEW